MSEQVLIKCKCSTVLLEEDFVKHFTKCDEFKKTFKIFDAQFGELLKQYSDPKENLLIIRCLLKQYINVLDVKVKKA